MGHQDFERYADEKPFGSKPPKAWCEIFSEALNRLGKPVEDIAFLDMGCGDGRFFPYLVEQGLAAGNIHGVEVSHARLKRCHALGWVNARHIEKGQPLPYEDSQFHAINFIEVIEHIPESEAGAVLSEIRRVLAPGGFLMISTPNYPIKRFYDLYAALVFGKRLALRDDPTHVTFYNPSRLTDLLARHFQTIEARSFKDGFLYKYLPRPFFRHKLFYLCS